MRPVLALVCASCVLAGIAGFAQQQQPQQQQQPSSEDAIIKVDVDLVNVLFSVRDKKGALISDLTQDDFEVYEDGKLQQVRAFTRETDLPLTLGLLVDVSRSQENLIEVERRAASLFFSQVLRNKDMAFLISFGSEAELLQDYTNSKVLLEEGLRALRVAGGAYSPIGPGPVPTIGQPRGTILYDAIYLAADEKLKREVGRKAIVVITDGVDQGSRVQLREAIDSAHRSDSMIYSIYYVDHRAYGGMFHPSDGDLKKMSEETGGRVHRVDRKHTLEEIFDEIQREMRSQYAVAYSSTNPARDGGFRKLEIKPKNKNYRVQARKGYFASK